jgi:hypothetical protein
LDVCVLSQEEAGRLENWGIWPNCKAHLHIKKSRALEAVEKLETHRFIGGEDTSVKAVGHLSMIVPIDTTRIWSPVQCHNAEGMTLRGMRTWGLRPLK